MVADPAALPIAPDNLRYSIIILFIMLVCIDPALLFVEEKNEAILEDSDEKLAPTLRINFAEDIVITKKALEVLLAIIRITLLVATLIVLKPLIIFANKDANITRALSVYFDVAMDIFIKE
jgi:hypothetical protein